MFLLSPKTLSNIWASFVKQWSPLLLKIAQSGHIGIQRVERFICKQNNYEHLKMLRKEVSFSSLKRQNLLLSDGYAQDLKVHDVKLTNVFAQKSVFIMCQRVIESGSQLFKVLLLILKHSSRCADCHQSRCSNRNYDGNDHKNDETCCSAANIKQKP